MSYRLSRRSLLTAAAALIPLGPFPAAAQEGEKSSHAAMYGAAPFDTPHLLPGDPVNLTLVDRTAPAARIVALTIDDGPDDIELEMAEALRAADAKATFFAIGQKLRRYPDPALRLAAEGHEIGCHSQTHPLMTTQSADEQEREFRQSLAAFSAAGLPAPTWFRPPYGDWNGAVARRARTHGMRTIVWTVDSRDWKTTKPATVFARVAENLDPAAVVLVHGTRAATAKALPDILAEGRKRGLTFVTMSRWYEVMKTLAAETPVSESQVSSRVSARSAAGVRQIPKAL
jgi:peptidoglycan-N-acetylglucosamine deacetylase